MTNFKNVLSLTGQFFKKNAPSILSIAGATMIIGGTVNACHVSRHLDESAKYLMIKRRVNTSRAIEDDKQRRKELSKSYAVLSAFYFKKYVLGGALILGGIGSMGYANIILNNRNTALSTAYTALASSVAAYRTKVKDLIGSEEESHIWNNEEAEKGTVTKIDENGEMKDEETDVFTRKSVTPFSRLFGDGYTPYWQKDGRTILAHLQASEANVNAMLRERGTLSMNDVWREIGFNDCYTREGAILGWKYVKDDPVFGDTYIDLGFSSKEENQFRIDMLKNSWNQEVWIDVFPPHVLTRCLKREKHRTLEEKNNILKTRKEIEE